MMRTAIATVLLAVLAAAPGCPQGPDNGAPTYTNGAPAIYYYGDSLGAFSRGLMREHYATETPAGTVRDNTMIGGTFLQDWHPAMRNVPAGSVVVVELATNNLLNETHQVTEQHMLNTLNILRERGVSRVVWLSLNEYVGELRGYPYLSRVRWMNDYMASLVASGAYADIGLEIYDWNALAYPQGRAWIHIDNLHHNGPGAIAFGCAMYEAVVGPACMEAL